MHVSEGHVVLAGLFGIIARHQSASRGCCREQDAENPECCDAVKTQHDTVDQGQVDPMMSIILDRGDATVGLMRGLSLSTTGRSVRGSGVIVYDQGGRRCSRRRVPHVLGRA